MPLTLEKLQSVLADEKLAKITFKRVIESFSEGKCYQEILGISDHLMQQLYDIALEYLEDRHYDEAADCFLFLIALNPFESNLWLKAGNAEHARGHFDEALEAYSMAMFCDADDPFPHFYSAKIYAEQKEKHRAHECLDICEKLIHEHHQFKPLQEMVNQFRSSI